jgi:hypothetical protein
MIHALQDAGRWAQARQVLESMNISIASKSSMNRVSSTIPISAAPAIAVVGDNVEEESQSNLAKTANSIANEYISIGDANLLEGTLISETSDHVVIDLHGTTQPIAFSVIESYFEQQYESYLALGDQYIPKEVQIITGRGNHVNSKGLRGVLRLSIEDFINTMLYPRDALKIRYDPRNDGCFFVTAESISDWINRKDSMHRGRQQQLDLVNI